MSMDVRLAPDTSFVADVLVYRETGATASDNWFESAELVLVVEVVGPHTRTLDRLTKPARYAQAGIPCYWRVEPEPQLVVHTYALDPTAEVYRDTGSFIDLVAVERPWPIRLPLASVGPRSG